MKDGGKGRESKDKLGPTYASDLELRPDKLRTAMTVFIVLTLMVWILEKPRLFGTELNSHTCSGVRAAGECSGGW